jgi:hypothetical protein
LGSVLLQNTATKRLFLWLKFHIFSDETIPTIYVLLFRLSFVEGHLMADHVHMCLSIPPKYAVSNVVGFIKGKSAISIARIFRGKSKNFTGENFWARGYFVSTVGLDEVMVRNYIREQEREDEHYEQLNLWKS